MNKTFLWTAAALALCLAGSASAQPHRGATATLYEFRNFQGRSVTVTGSVADLGDWRFNDRAQSARFQGRWRICEHDDFRGRCQVVSGDVADLTTYGLMGQVSSLDPVGGDRGPPPPPRARPDAKGIEGSRTVFFPRPTIGGLDVAAGDRGADTFCRRQGLGSAVWYDSSERAREAVAPDGRRIGGSTVLRDLLCRRY